VICVKNARAKINALSIDKKVKNNTNKKRERRIICTTLPSRFEPG
jgi:hypothetical protein